MGQPKGKRPDDHPRYRWKVEVHKDLGPSNWQETARNRAVASFSVKILVGSLSQRSKYERSANPQWGRVVDYHLIGQILLSVRAKDQVLRKQINSVLSVYAVKIFLQNHVLPALLQTLDQDER
ncbi:unnamed protein product, partial [Iphiclides podalirius]